MVDRSIPAKARRLVIMGGNGGYEAKRIVHRPRKDVWGVVTWVVHEM